MVGEQVSIRPSEMVEGGAVPVEQNLTWKECRFNLFDYKKKDGTIVATTVAARIIYVTDEGTEMEQQYSVGDKERFAPSEDGKTLIALTPATALSKSSNFFLLMSALINAGFPEAKLTGDISILDGLYTYNIGLAEPKRAGLRPAEAVEGARERVISVPSQIHKLPWEKKGKGAGAGPAAAAGTDVTAEALKFVGEVLDEAEGDSVTRQELAVAAFKKLAKDPNKDAIASLIFQPEFQGALLGNGYAVDGESISRAA